MPINALQTFRLTLCLLVFLQSLRGASARKLACTACKYNNYSPNGNHCGVRTDNPGGGGDYNRKPCNDPIFADGFDIVASTPTKADDNTKDEEDTKTAEDTSTGTIQATGFSGPTATPPVKGASLQAGTGMAMAAGSASLKGGTGMMASVAGPASLQAGTGIATAAGSASLQGGTGMASAAGSDVWTAKKFSPASKED